jgi:tRNA (guanine-N(7)-)-methyltransferase subunit TRM82
MPKRPCDLAVTSDDETILVADKFGDVYSLPLVDSSAVEPVAEVPKAAQPLVSKGANSLTVHSQRNRKALVDQERQRQFNPQPKTKEAPTFMHELLIGHVSMLTSVAVASAEGRPYILTADRDEHIRVSRGVPQAHVIENFCLGHKSFVNALCLPRPDVLVSAGGDDELYVWDWRAGVLKDKVDLLTHVQQVAPESKTVAVTRLVSSEDGWVFAICERQVFLSATAIPL